MGEVHDTLYMISERNGSTYTIMGVYGILTHFNRKRDVVFIKLPVISLGFEFILE